MLKENLKKLFTKDMDRLVNELELYENESDIWKIKGEVTNCAGNLTLHLVGNLQHFIGKELGGTDFIRSRELEFSLKNVSRKTLINQIENTKEIIIKTLESLEENQLEAQYPLLVLNETTSTEFFLLHLSSHLSYHLGQINYHRRLIKF
jgi:uncharacterized damage-inducible protein DinB